MRPSRRNRHGRGSRPRLLRRAAQRNRRLVGEWLEPRSLLASDIRGLVWHDVNQNGLLDASEPGLQDTLGGGVATTDTVIGNSDDKILTAAATNSAGNYNFAAVADGQYYLRFRRQPVG